MHSTINTSNLKYIFFDLDDTLCNYKQAKKNAQYIINEELGKNNIAFDAFWIKYNEIEPCLLKEFLKNNLTIDQYRKKRFYDVLQFFRKNSFELSENLNRIYIGISNNTNLFNDVIPMLKYIIKKNIELALLTNGPSDGQRKKMGNYIEYFKKIYISEEIGSSKPNKSFFEFILNDLNILPNQALMVGDSVEDDVIGSSLAGIPCILIDRFNVNNTFNGPRIKNLFELKDMFK